MDKTSKTCSANIESLRVLQAVYHNTNLIMTKCIVTPLSSAGLTQSNLSHITYDTAITVAEIE